MNESSQDSSIEVATFGGGCYWCIEAVFQQLKGIISIVSGFSGGENADPDYREVCSGRSDHIEVVKVEFDPQQLPYEQLLAVFFAGHDPTQLNRQGHDVGPQYRSVVFYHSEQQHQTTRQMIDKLETAQLYPGKIVTEVRPSMPFFKAPEYHQDYYNNSQYNPYCQIVIKPKLDKVRQLFSEQLI